MAVHEALEAAYADAPGWAQVTLRVLLVLLVGAVVAWFVKKYVVRILTDAPRIDRTLSHFLTKLVSTGIWIVVFVVALTVAGVDLAALLGGLAIGGFIVGFALKDTLGNLAAGVVLLFYRPFNVGDFVGISSHTGTVAGLGVALTTLTAVDGRIITLPNGKVLGDAIINYTRNAHRRIDVKVSIGYDDDIDAAVRCILAAFRSDARVLEEPEPLVRISGLGESGVDVLAAAWVRTSDFIQAGHDFHALVKSAVREAGCTIPYPQRVVRQV